MRSDICAVIPAYGCERTIASVVAGVRQYLESVWVVDDGSADRTGEVAERAGARVEHLEKNRGKGFALRRGVTLAAAGGARAILLLDGDGQHDPGDIPAFLEAWDARRGELILGNRWGDVAAIPGVRYWTNYIGSRALSWTTGRELIDTQSGYRLLSTDLAVRMRLRSDGYEIESEILIKAAKLGVPFAYVPVRTIYGEQESHFKPLRDTLRIVRASVYFQIFNEDV